MYNKIDEFANIIGTTVIAIAVVFITFSLGVIVREGIEFKKECVEYSKITGECLRYNVKYKNYTGEMYLKEKADNE